MLSGVNRGSPWAEKQVICLKVLLVLILLISLLTGDAVSAAGRVPAEPDVWTDGSLVEDEVSGVDQGFLVVVLAVFGLIVDGDILMMMLVGTWPLGLVVAFVLFLVCCRLFREQSSGRSFLHFRLLMAFTLVLTTLALFVMSVACWMAMLVPVLLSLSRMVISFCLLVRCLG